MQTILAYLYAKTIKAQIIGDAETPNRNRVVYSRTLKLHRNADNKIKMILRDANQKPITLDTFDVVLEVVRRDQDTVVQTFSPVDTVGNANNVAVFVLPAAFVNTLDSIHYYVTAKKQNATLESDEFVDEEPIYIDDNYGVQLPVEVLPGFGRKTDATPDVYDPQMVIDGGGLDEPVTNVIDLGNV